MQFPRPRRESVVGILDDHFAKACREIDGGSIQVFAAGLPQFDDPLQEGQEAGPTMLGLRREIGAAVEGL